MRDKYLLMEDLFKAYYDARKNKRNTINQMRFEINYEKYLLELYEDILNRTYKISPSVCFIVNKPVQREIFAADFRDRVIHHLLYNYVNPIFEKIFIDDSYSCRKHKGTLYGIKRIREFIRECSSDYTGDCFILKLDIQGYFMNINKKKLHDIINDIFENIPLEDSFGLDMDMIYYLIETILEDDPTRNCKIKGVRSDWNGLPPAKSLFGSPGSCGLPIGNLTSQLFSNVYLHILDCYITRQLGMRYYGRYVDDFIVVHSCKEKLRDTITLIKDFLKNELHLELHPLKIYLQHYSKGVNFLGATIKPHRTYISNRTKKNFISCIRLWNRRLLKTKPTGVDLGKMRAGINSYLGIMRHHYSYNIRKKALVQQPNLLFQYGYFTNSLHRFVIKKNILNKNVHYPII